MSHCSGGYAIAIIWHGNVVKTRQDGRVAIPFDSDYGIRLINRNGKRAVAKVVINAEVVTDEGVIVPAYGSLDLERPVDKAVTFRFAFIESKASDEHGKGLIKVEWRPERTSLPYATASSLTGIVFCKNVDKTLGLTLFDIDYDVQPIYTAMKLMGYEAEEEMF